MGSDGSITVNVDASSNPDAISAYLKANPNDPANSIKPAAPVSGAPTISPPPFSGGGASASASAPGVGAPQPGSTQSNASGDGPWSDYGSVDTPAMTRARSDAANREAGVPAWERAIGNGFAFGAGGTLDAGAAKITTGVHNAVAHAFGLPDAGYSMDDAYNAVRQADMGIDKNFATQHPIQAGTLGVVGMAANPLTWTGGGYVAGAKTLGATIGRAALVNGGIGAAYGLGGAAPDQHINGALTGGALGVATAPVAPLVGAVAAPLVRPAQRFATDVAAPWAAKNLGAAGALLQKALPSASAVQNQAALDALRSVGIDPATFSLADNAAIAAHVNAGRSGADAAMSVAGQGLPVPVPMSVGQVTGEPGQQLTENLALRGAGGPVGQNAQVVAKGFQANQQAALRGNVAAIGAQIGGGVSTAPGEGGVVASDALNAGYDAAKAGVDNAYNAARASGPASLPTYDAQALAGSVGTAVKDYDPLNIPRVTREVGRLASLTTGPTDPDIGALFAARTRLTNLRASNDPVEAGAAAKAVSAFDQGINSNLSNALFQGDPATVKAWQAAIGARRDFGKLFQSGDLVAKLTAREPRSGTMQLAVDPHDATNYIFGRANMGFVGKANLYRDLNQMKAVLGANSPAWNAIRSETFNRLATAGEGTVEAGSAQFSGVKFAKAWAGMNRADPALVTSLYTPQEQATLNRFAAVSSRVTAPVKGGDNSSNTAVAAMTMLRRLPFIGLKAVPFVGEHIADAIDSAARTRAIANATVRAAPRLAGPTVSGQFGKVALKPIVSGAMVGQKRGQ